MIVGFGIDVVDVARIERQISGPSAERFLARVFTARERAFCDARRDRANPYAARFAAKEAAMKALGAPAGLRFTDFEVRREGGAPALVMTGAARRAAEALGVGRTHLTLAHDGGVAVAAVIMESP